MRVQRLLDQWGLLRRWYYATVVSFQSQNCISLVGVRDDDFYEFLKWDLQIQSKTTCQAAQLSAYINNINNAVVLLYRDMSDAEQWSNVSGELSRFVSGHSVC